MKASRILRSPSGARTLAPGAPCICVGHRGARAFAPENTLEAFRKAAALGCAMVELDVHRARDGELVVHHDDDLGRCTNAQTVLGADGATYLSDCTLAELQRLDVGSWYVAELAKPPNARQPFLRSLNDFERDAHVTPDERRLYASGAVRIPTLRDTLALAKDLDLMVNVEIKSIPRLYDGIADRVVDVVREAGMGGSVLVSSFDHEQLVAVRRLDPDLATGVLTSDRLARPDAYLEMLDADSYHPGCHDLVDSLGFGSVTGNLQLAGIEAVSNAGKYVFAWTCNDPARMARLVAAGVTGIITDFPNRFPA